MKHNVIETLYLKESFQPKLNTIKMITVNRKKFIKNGILGLGGTFTLPQLLSSCKDNKEGPPQDIGMDSTPMHGAGGCPASPMETKGPFPIKTPAEWVRENIIVDRKGIPLLITLDIQEKKNDCNALSDVIVDIWHCDAGGNYSEYGGMRMQPTDYTDKHFLRGRQTTNANGQVSFLSIFPGWYPGRAPHIHVEVLDKNEKSLLVTQIAFEETEVNKIYETEHYRGPADQKNETDFVFRNSLEGNMADSLTGNISDGYTLKKTIIV